MTADGFHAHKMTWKAQMTLYVLKILFVIEEGDTSHIDQPFDDKVARDNKCIARRGLDTLRAHGPLGPVIDQYSLVVILCHCVRETPDDAWEASFKACNLHPDHRVPFHGEP